MIELMRAKLEAYKEREAHQRGEALAAATMEEHCVPLSGKLHLRNRAAELTRAADWTALKISMLERELTAALAAEKFAEVRAHLEAGATPLHLQYRGSTVGTLHSGARLGGVDNLPRLALIGVR